MAHIRTRLRWYVFTISLLIMAGITTFIIAKYPEVDRSYIFVRVYALCAIGYLYLSLLISPLYQAFPKLPYRAQAADLRRPLGVMAFLYGLAHARVGFFEILGGFDGLSILRSDYLQAVIYALTALTILTIMAVTAFDGVVQRMGGWWKRLHRLVYLAGYLILLHALALGEDFSNPSSIIFKIAFILFFILMFLEARRMDRFLRNKGLSSLSVGLTTLVMTGVLVLGVVWASSTGARESLRSHMSSVKDKEHTHNTHYHANFLVNINGTTLNFSDEKYMEAVLSCSTGPNKKPEERGHLHNGVGDVIHIHDEGVTWADFFTNLGFTLGNTLITTDTGQIYSTGNGGTLAFILNGQKLRSVAGLVVKSEDRLLVYFGNENTDAVMNLYNQVPTTAVEQNSKPDPATCSGSS